MNQSYVCNISTKTVVVPITKVTEHLYQSFVIYVYQSYLCDIKQCCFCNILSKKFKKKKANNDQEKKANNVFKNLNQYSFKSK